MKVLLVVTVPWSLAQALRWLEALAPLMPETVKVEASSYLILILAALAALWIWRRNG